MIRFTYLAAAQQVIFEPGALQRLDEVVARFDFQRVLVCSVSSLRAGGHTARVETALGRRWATTFEPAQPHVPDFQVADAVKLAEAAGADAVLGFGGGSPIGLAKAVSMALEERRTGLPAAATYPTEQPLVPVIAIPTTYAGSEMTPIYGVTHHDSDPPRKVTVSDPKIAPRLVLYDPDLTLDLPPEATAASGINALAHCVEAYYSARRNPLCSAAALEGARRIGQALPRCWADPADRQARAEMMLGAHLAGAALANVAMALHHGLCHVLGGSAGVPHGIANAIVLPHVMRFNAEAAAAELAQVGAALGAAPGFASDHAAALAAAERVNQMAAHMNLPQRLRQAGVAEADLPRLAELALQSKAVQSNPRPIRDAAEVEALLRDMW